VDGWQGVNALRGEARWPPPQPHVGDERLEELAFQAPRVIEVNRRFLLGTSYG
jgi:hypothetical protein